MTDDIGILSTQVARLHELVSALDRATTAHLETHRVLIDAQAKMVELALASSDKAVAKAEVANERRFESVNEFRAQLADQVSRFATRETVDILTGANRRLIEDTAERTRLSVDDLKAQTSRLMIALLTTLIASLLAALVYNVATR